MVFKKALKRKETVDTLRYSEELFLSLQPLPVLTFQIQQNKVEIFFGLFERTISFINPIFLTIFSFFRKIRQVHERIGTDLLTCKVRSY